MEIQFLSKVRILGYGTTQMRCVQPSEYLANKGWNVGVACIYRSYPKASKAIIFHRTVIDRQSTAALCYVKAKGRVAIYDIDDLLFELEGNSLELLEENKIHNNVSDDVSKSYRDFMLQCDVVLVSTNYLKKKAEAFHPDVRLIKNGISKWFEEKSDIVRENRPVVTSRAVTIAYLSGSSHHDLDFKLIENTLFNIMKEFPDAKLKIVGKLNYSSKFLEFGDRFIHIPFMNYAEFWKVFEDIDINLAPLRTNVPFAQARSEIKYMEASAFGIPTIASATETYREAISNGINGLLIENQSGWYEALVLLIENKEERYKLGEAARIDAIENYGYKKRSAEWDGMISNVLRCYARGPKTNKFTLTVLKIVTLYHFAIRMIRISVKKITTRRKVVQ